KLWMDAIIIFQGFHFWCVVHVTTFWVIRQLYRHFNVVCLRHSCTRKGPRCHRKHHQCLFHVPLHYRASCAARYAATALTSSSDKRSAIASIKFCGSLRRVPFCQALICA